MTTVEVTLNDYLGGQIGGATRCMLARALARTFAFDNVFVSGENGDSSISDGIQYLPNATRARFGRLDLDRLREDVKKGEHKGTYDYVTWIAELPPIAVKAMNDFDSGKKNVSVPFSFEIDA